jgi:hypothetical protein
VLRESTLKNVMIVELRHEFGNIKDEDGVLISVKEELEVIEKVFDHIKEDYPHF